MSKSTLIAATTKGVISKIRRKDVKSLVSAVFVGITSIGSGLIRATIVTTANPIVIDMQSLGEIMFVSSASIGAPKTWIITNIGSALFIPSLIFTMTTLDIQSFPANFKMLSFDANWNSSNQQWTPPDVGNYEMSATFDGTFWLMKIQGQFV